LKPGEQVRTRNGVAEVLALNPRSNAEPVFNIEVHGEHVYRVGKTGVLVHNKAMKVNRKPLPELDSTGKVHGDLPRAQDLDKYPLDELERLRDQLEQSVQERIRVTSRLGRDKAHGQRQAAEQQLSKQIDKLLEE